MQNHDDFDGPTAPNRPVPAQVQSQIDMDRLNWINQQTFRRLATTNILLTIIAALLFVLVCLVYWQRPVTVGELTDLSKSNKTDALAKRQTEVPITNIRGAVSVIPE
jgi:hypothetical protein